MKTKQSRLHEVDRDLIGRSARGIGEAGAQRKYRFGKAVLSLLTVAASFACGELEEHTQPSNTAAPTKLTAPPLGERELELFEEVATLRDGSRFEYQRGILSVPMQRSVADSKMLGLEFHRFPATVSTDAPPIVRLMGGPGFEGLSGLIERPGYLESNVLRYTAAADLVVMGQRGFGSSGDLRCADPAPLAVEDAMDASVRHEAVRAALRECQSSLETDGVEIEGFSVLEMSADVMEVTHALGHDRFQLLGNSFGTHVGMAILRLYPHAVARATFNGLEGPDHTYDSPTGKWTALERIAAAAERSAELRDLVPPDGFLSAYRALIARSKDAPIEVEVTIPGSDDRTTLRLGPDDLAELPLMGMTAFSYRWPSWIINLIGVLDGDLEREATELLRRRMNPSLDPAAYYQLDCGSGISPQRAARYRSDPANALLGPSQYFVACSAWDADSGEAFRADFLTDVPVLLVQGDRDTSTPYSNALELLPSFNDRHFVHVEGGSHGAILEAMDDRSFAEALTHWFATGDRSGFPDSIQGEAVEWRRPD